MSESVIIAEINKGTVAGVTAELVSAALALGTTPTIVVPCTDASVADGAGFEGVSKTIAVKATVSQTRRCILGSCYRRCCTTGIIIAAATPQSKDVAQELLQEEDFQSFKT
ncbi:MAG: hypothetical protein CM15mP1_0640 [Methanobacteriota archaeon]|nr:MAG: hypothetical protein CM15mP1_0640 [Euryarchaeota archaeon]